MIWLAWRQLRIPAALVFGALALAGVGLAVTGPQLADVLRNSGDSFFDTLAADRFKTFVFTGGTALAYAVPSVVGVFWGAPMLAREIDAGTHRLVWNQSITRTRWLGTKLGLTAVAAAAAGGIGLALTWWAAPIDDAIASGLDHNGAMAVPRLWPDLFGARGVVPIGMAVLALATGATAGLLVRRTVPAMALTLAAVIGVQVATPMFLSEDLLRTERLTTTITSDNLRGLMIEGEPGTEVEAVNDLDVGIDSPGAWVIENVTLGPDGEVAETLPAWVEECGTRPGRATASSEACFARMEAEGYQQRIEYLPASRFWALQWVETGILLGAAGLLAGFCFWRVRRDLT